MKKTAIILIVLAIFSKFFGFLREVALARFYGASQISDAYIISISIPNTILSILLAALTVGFIPTLHKSKSNHKEENIITNSLVLPFFIISSVFVILMNVFPNFFITIFAIGIDKLTYNNIKEFLTYTSWTLLIGVFTNVLIQYLRIKSYIYISALSTIPSNIIIIISIYLSNYYSNVSLLYFGFLVAISSQFIIVLVYSIKAGYRINFFNINPRIITEFILFSTPIMLSTLFIDLNKIVDRNLASLIGIGGISIISYSERIISMVFAILTIIITVIFYPNISKLYNSDDKNKSQAINIQIKETFDIVSILGFLMILITFFHSDFIIYAIFNQSILSTYELNLLSLIIIIYIFSIIPNSYKTILSKLYFLENKTSIVVKLNIIQVALNIFVSIALYFLTNKQLYSIALGTTISSFIGYYSIHHNYNKNFKKGV